jgi:hypothetical protein
MANQEEEVLNHLTTDHAEGGSDLLGGEDAFEADGFESEDGLEADGLEDSLEADMLDFEGEDGFESEDALEAEAEVLTPGIAAALRAESEDAFFGGLVNAFKKAAPIIGKIAKVAAPVLSAIPFPPAQIAAKVADIAGQLAGEAAEAGEGEDGVLQRAAEAAAEAAVMDRRARPVVVGVVSRQVAKNRAAPLPPAHRQQIVRQVNNAAKILTRSGGPQAIRALPKIAASVNRTGDARGTSLAGRLAVLRRSVGRVAQRPQLLRKLAQPTQRGQRLGRMLRSRTGMPGGFGPAGYGAGGSAPGGTGYGRNGRQRRRGWGGADWGPYGWLGGGDGNGARRITMDGPCTITITPL